MFIVLRQCVYLPEWIPMNQNRRKDDYEINFKRLIL